MVAVQKRCYATQPSLTALCLCSFSQRQAHDAVAKDPTLLVSVATKIARALSLEGNNQVLAKKVVALALSAQDEAGFQKASEMFGDLSNRLWKSTTADIYFQVKQSVKSTTIRLQSGSTGTAAATGVSGFGGGRERLELGPQVGGLQKKKKVGGLQSHLFNSGSSKPKSAKRSLLGLDALADEMREEKGETLPKSAKKHRLMAMGDDDEDGEDDDGFELFNHSKGDSKKEKADSKKEKADSKQKKQYRGQMDATPSHPGGVDRQAQEAILERENRRKSWSSKSGSSKDDGRGDRRDDERRRDDRRDDDRRRDDRRDDRRRDGDRGSSNSSRRESSSSSGYRDSDQRSSREVESARSTPSTRPASTPGQRSGLGMDTDDWEAPVSLRSTPMPTPVRDGEWEGSETPTIPRSGDGEWDMPTPSPMHPSGKKQGERQGPGVLVEETPSNWVNELDDDGKIQDPEMKAHYQSMEDQYDRSFYLQEEGAAAEDSGGGAFLGNEQKFSALEAEMAKQRAKGDHKLKGMSARKSALNADQERWEENRLLTSGVVRETEVDMDFDAETESRVTLMVHTTKPPFLGGKVQFSAIQHVVSTVVDPTCDMAICAKRGSALVSEVRQQKEQSKMRQRFWELGGSRMGDAMGIKNAQTEAAAAEKSEVPVDESELNYKEESQYATHLKKQEAVSAFAMNKSIKEQREYLPVFDVHEELMQVIRENQIIIIVGETGSGKTTQLTQYLHEGGFTQCGMIGCTQPRRVAAMSVAKRVSEEVGCELGQEVGYAIRFEDVTSENTVIKYMTDGVLLRESIREPDLDSYSCIVMDEAHERSLNTDVLFGILRKVCQKRRDIKLIVTSATMDSKKFADFYGGVPEFHIPGRTFHVEKYFTKTPSEDYVDAAVKQVLNIHLSFPPGDILVFMTGQEDIEATCSVLAERVSHIGEGVSPLLLLPMYSQLAADLQAKIFDKADDETRKCIVSTNIAETSLTVDGIIYVVDSGYCKLKVYNPKIGMDSLQITPISKANANQRAGRAGRTGPGFCYRLYTERQFNDELLAAQVPEIQRTNLGNVVLLLKTLGVDNLLEFGFMDPPPQANIENSMYQLWILGALSNTGDLTPIGKKMSEFPLVGPIFSATVFFG
jgi:pre-mRNA-splicing factor ATP-dependent RNA helicase DHX38/PRP16